MGLLCSKSEKQTAHVSPVVDGVPNPVDEHKQPTEVREANPASPRTSPRASPLLDDANPEVEAQAETLVKEDTGPNEEREFVPLPVQSPENHSTPAITDDHTDGTRIAVIGTCESGKSTVCRQIAAYCKEPPHEIELRHRPAYINDFFFVAMKKLLEHMQTLGMSLADSENQKYVEFIETIGDRRGRPLMKPEIDALACLWDDESIQKTYESRGEINLNDSVSYFFSSIDRIAASPDYVPTTEDLIMLYVPSVGVTHYSFDINNQEFLIYDVSGRMVEQKKWMNFYDHFDALIFTLAISEFDQTLETESGKQSRLMYALNLLSEVASDERFKSTPLFIFLNEVDIFKKKLTRLSFKNYLPTYNGSSEKDALAFVKQMAADQCMKHRDKLHFYFTTAVNPRKMTKVFNEMFKKISKVVD